jgi:tetratricopeptide (TPR) repeat protein
MSEIAELPKEEKSAPAPAAEPAASPEQPEAPDANAAISPSDEEAVRSLMSDIAALQREEEPAPPPPLSTEPSPDAKTSPFATPGKKEAEEDFFDLGAELSKEAGAAPSAPPRKEPAEEFFDLAAELRDELGSMAPSAKATSGVLPEEQSLDDIFEEFKKGVVQQAEKEDTGTHYNLGVAYKEMGLLEDAIAEFVMTREGESIFVQSKYMLGLCYMEMGEYQNAVDEIMNALNYGMSRGMTDQERIPMQYDLGLAYQGFGNIKEAISEFQQVSDVDPRYRDTAAKLKELRKGDFISLEQLKDDIEKEISAKFFEEGERIERKEKSRKSDKIRS